MPMNIKKDWNAKLEIAYSFMLKYSKITVWVPVKSKMKISQNFVTFS